MHQLDRHPALERRVEGAVDASTSRPSRPSPRAGSAPLIRVPITVIYFARFDACRVRYYTDPACSASWGAEPSCAGSDGGVRRRPAFTYVMGGLARDYERIPDARRARRGRIYGPAPTGSTGRRHAACRSTRGCGRRGRSASTYPGVHGGKGGGRAGARGRQRYLRGAARGADLLPAQARHHRGAGGGGARGPVWTWSGSGSTWRRTRSWRRSGPTWSDPGDPRRRARARRRQDGPGGRAGGVPDRDVRGRRRGEPRRLRPAAVRGVPRGGGGRGRRGRRRRRRRRARGARAASAAWRRRRSRSLRPAGHDRGCAAVAAGGRVEGAAGQVLTGYLWELGGADVADNSRRNAARAVASPSPVQRPPGRTNPRASPGPSGRPARRPA